MSEQWFDVTPRSSAFEVQLNTDGQYRHRPKLRPYGPEPSAAAREWAPGRPLEARPPLRGQSKQTGNLDGLKQTDRRRSSRGSSQAALSTQHQDHGRGPLHEAGQGHRPVS
jgi:hypothetical protein